MTQKYAEEVEELVKEILGIDMLCSSLKEKIKQDDVLCPLGGAYKQALNGKQIVSSNVDPDVESNVVQYDMILRNIRIAARNHLSDIVTHSELDRFRGTVIETGKETLTVDNGFLMQSYDTTELTEKPKLGALVTVDRLSGKLSVEIEE